MLHLLQFRSVVDFPVLAFAVHTVVLPVCHRIYNAAAAAGFLRNFYLLHILVAVFYHKNPLEIAVEEVGH